MYRVVLGTSDRKSGIIVIGFEENEVAPVQTAAPEMYYHVRLSECFPDAEDLQYEHIVFTTVPFDLRGDRLNEILDDTFRIDRAFENVQVCELPPDIIRKLRANPAQGHTFDLGAGATFPLLIVVLGGKKGVQDWMDENTQKA